ncbi:MAG TPA: hypothetical protein PLQ35_03920 [bacterium]|nr:hypothetical protein [bacterium]HQL61419.1 hypothetical protein [bacterium]
MENMSFVLYVLLQWTLFILIFLGACYLINNAIRNEIRKIIREEGKKLLSEKRED